MKQNDKDKTKPTKPQSPEPPQDHNALWPALTIDYALYEQYLEDSDLTDEQKREFIETLWNIIVAFVDLGFNVHPLQQALSNGCGQNQILTDLLLPESDVVVKCEINPEADNTTKSDEQFGASRERSQT